MSTIALVLFIALFGTMVQSQGKQNLVIQNEIYFIGDEEAPSPAKAEFDFDLFFGPEPTRNCYIEKRIGSVVQWKNHYDTSDKNCLGKHMIADNDRLYAVFSVQGDSNEKSSKFFLNNEQFGAAPVFQNGKGILTNIPTRASVQDYIDVLVIINRQNGQITSGTTLYSSYRRFPSPEITSYPLNVNSISFLQLSSGNTELVVNAVSVAYPPSTTTSKNRFQFDDNHQAAGKTWTIRMRSDLSGFTQTRQSLRELQESEAKASFVGIIVATLLLLL